MSLPCPHSFRGAGALLLLLCALVTTLGLMPDTAFAGKQAKQQTPQTQQKYIVKKVGIASFDKVFVRLGEINEMVGTAETQLKTARRNYNTAMGLKNKATWVEGLAELQSSAQGKVKVLTTGKSPKLEASDALPSNIKAGIDALNGTIDAYALSIEALASVPSEVQTLVEQCKKFPSQFWTDLGNVKITELGKTFKKAKKIKNNLGVALSLPGRTADVVSEMNTNISLIASTFGATWPPSALTGGDSGRTQPDAKKKGKKKGKKKKN
jgi:hypothetical protein